MGFFSSFFKVLGGGLAIAAVFFAPELLAFGAEAFAGEVAVAALPEVTAVATAESVGVEAASFGSKAFSTIKSTATNIGLFGVANSVLGLGLGGVAIAANQELTSRQVDNTITEGKAAQRIEEDVNIPVARDNIAIIEQARRLERNRESRGLRSSLSRIRASQSQGGFSGGEELINSALNQGELDILVGDFNAEVNKLQEFRNIDKAKRSGKAFIRQSTNQASELRLGGNIRSARIGTELILQPVQRTLQSATLRNT